VRRRRYKPLNPSTLVGGGSVALSACLGATTPNAQAMEGHVVVPYDSFEFAPLLGGPTQIAVVSGIPQTGPSFIILRFPPNSPGVMHSHTAGYHAMVVSGAFKHWVKGADVATVPLQTPGD